MREETIGVRDDDDREADMGEAMSILDELLETSSSESEEDVTRLVDRVLTARERLARIEAQAEQVISRAKKDVERLEEWALPIILQYAKTHPPKRGKTLHLVTGSVSLRTIKEAVVVDDPASVMEHVPEVVREVSKRVVDKGALDEYVKRTGHVPDGVRIVEEHERVYVKGPKD